MRAYDVFTAVLGGIGALVAVWAVSVVVLAFGE